MTYPLFIPPDHLALRRSSEWSLSEAQEYFEWFLAMMNNRVEELYVYFNETASSNLLEDLALIGEHASRAIRNPLFSYEEDGKLILTDSGYALAADLGLLLAKGVMQAEGELLKWVILSKPKNHISYNLPVLSGFDKKKLDPILVSISTMYGVLKGTFSGDAWVNAFKYWTSIL